MSEAPLLAGIDIGSTNCKVGIYTVDGSPVAELSRPTVADCDKIARGVLADLAACLSRAGRAPVAVGVTSMAESGVALDADLRPLHPLFRWDDPRAAAEAEAIDSRVGRAALFATTGVSLGSKTPLARWLWLRHHCPRVLRDMRVWVSAADLIATVLIGRPVTDPTLAGRTGALDQRVGRYDKDILGVVGVTAAQLPEIFVGQAGRARGGLGGLVPGTPVVVAGHDHLVAAFAAGARGPGDTADSMGTAEALITVTEHPPSPTAAVAGLSWNRHVDGSHWALVSGFPGSGRVVNWAAASLLGAVGDDAFQAFDELAATVARPTGIVVQPYLAGRAAPAPDPARTMSMRGVLATHRAPDIAMAVLEGACFHLRWMAEEQARHAGHPFGSCRVLGGPSRNRAWTAVKAEVMPWPVELCRMAEAACAGAALLAGQAVGIDPAVLPTEPLPRDAERAARYETVYTTEFLPEATR
ncbi:MAG: FGGY family carbohydrate kinase [Actinomycetota bacterium]|nr:FGGY family carbohydrate kinase [Actinomycetota bacterium]